MTTKIQILKDLSGQIRSGREKNHSDSTIIDLSSSKGLSVGESVGISKEIKSDSQKHISSHSISFSLLLQPSHTFTHTHVHVPALKYLNGQIGK